MNLTGIDLLQMNINLESEEAIAMHIELHQELNQE